MRIPCSAPGLDHIHWAGSPAEPFTLTYANPAADVGRIESADRVTLAALSTLTLCNPEDEPADVIDVLTEAEALEEILTDLEEGCDPGTAPLREELASRLTHLAA